LGVWGQPGLHSKTPASKKERKEKELNADYLNFLIKVLSYKTYRNIVWLEENI
jgi:hypothetical protein